MMKVSGLSRAQLEAMGEEKFFAKYGQQLKQEMGSSMQPTNMKQYAQGGQLTRFDEGGTHEQNPLGGIPQGEDSQGVMNTVEQGETKKGNYVYSDRLSIDENMAKQLHLPGYIKGKSFANASKAIDNKFRDRSDQYSQETKKTLLDRLKQGQEALKQQEQQKAQQLAQAMQANSQQSPGMGNNQVPPGMEQYVQSPQEEMAEGAASNPQEEAMEQPMEQPMAHGGMIKRADGSYSRRGLWDNIRANAGSGNEPTSEMLDQERKIRANAYGGMMNRYDLGGMPEVTPIGNTLKPAGMATLPSAGMPTAAMPTASQLGAPKGNLSGTTSTGMSGADALGYIGMAKSVADGDIKGAAMSGAQMAAAKGLFGAGAQNAMAAAGPALGVIGAGVGAYQLSEMAKGKGISRSKLGGAAQGALTGVGAGAAFGPAGMIIGGAVGLGAGLAGHDNAMRKYGQEMGKEALAKNSVYNDPSQIKSQRSAYGGYLNQHAMGGNIHINPANKGKFTASADAAGMGTQEFANHVLANKEDYSSTQVKRANFAHNAAGWHYAMGGQMNQYLLGGLFGGPTPLAKPGFVSNVNNNFVVPKIDPSSGSFKPNPSLKLDSKIDTSNLASMKGMPTTDFAASKFRNNNQYVPGAPNQIGNKYKPGFFSSSDRSVDGTPVFGDKYKTGLPGKPNMFSKESTLGRAGEFIKDNYGEMLNAAPAVYNAYKAMNPETSDTVAYNRLADTYKKSYIDRAALENINREETNNTINSLTNAAGGSNAALMANYAAANAGRIKGRSDAFLKTDAYDAEQNALKQEFDSGMNIRNQAVDTAEKNAQAQNDATTRNMNREYASAAMTNIGQFGKQQFDKKQVARMLGYDYKGGYIVDKTGNRVSPEEIAKAQANAKKMYEDTTATQATAYGGYLRTIKRMK